MTVETNSGHSLNDFMDGHSPSNVCVGGGMNGDPRRSLLFYLVCAPASNKEIRMWNKVHVYGQQWRS